MSKFRHKPKKLRQILKQSMSDNEKTVKEVTINGVTISEPKNVVEKLNKFFVHSITEINRSIPDRPFADS